MPMKRTVLRLPEATLKALVTVAGALSDADETRVSRAAVMRFYLGAAMTAAEQRTAETLGPFLATLDRGTRGIARGKKKKRIVLRMPPGMVARLDMLQARGAADPDAPTSRSGLVRALFAVTFAPPKREPRAAAAR